MTRYPGLFCEPQSGVSGNQPGGGVFPHVLTDPHKLTTAPLTQVVIPREAGPQLDKEGQSRAGVRCP